MEPEIFYDPLQLCTALKSKAIINEIVKYYTDHIDRMIIAQLNFLWFIVSFMIIPLLFLYNIAPNTWVSWSITLLTICIIKFTIYNYQKLVERNLSNVCDEVYTYLVSLYMVKMNGFADMSDNEKEQFVMALISYIDNNKK